MCDILYNQILLTEYNWSFFSVKALLLVCWPFCLLMGFLSGYLSWIYWFLCLTMASAAQNQEGVPEILRKQLAVAVRSIQWSYAIFWSLSAAQQGYIIFIFFFFFLFQVFHFYCPISFGAILFFFQLLYTILVSGVNECHLFG